MSGSGAFTEDPRLPPAADPRTMWRVVLDRHANGPDGRCAICREADCSRWRWAAELLADDQDAEARKKARGKGQRDEWGQDWRTSDVAAEPTASHGVPVDPSERTESQP